MSEAGNGNPSQAAGNGPALLDGLSVIDMGHYIAGPYCCRLMAALGANVIKVEPPWGEHSRRLGPFRDDIPDAENSGLFHYLNASKQGVTLNLKTQSGRGLFMEIAARADIIVENFEPRVLPSLGLDYEALRERNPGLVLTSISNFGQTGPYRDYKADEIGIHAISGEMYVAGESDQPPLKKGGNFAQYIAATTALSATLAAMYLREASGEGKHVDVSVLEALCTMHGSSVRSYSATGNIPRRVGDRGRAFPAGILPAADGSVVFSLIMARDWWDDFMKMVGAPELDDPRFRDRATRGQHADEIEAYTLPWLVEHSKEEVANIAQDFGLPAGVVATGPDLLASPQLQSRGYFWQATLPDGSDLRMPGVPYLLTGAGLPAPQRGPRLGEHNQEVLGGKLGLSGHDLVLLAQQGVI
jgi:crotonobetainyl-CoA:carnitine CoA-transferase CaiB-like acyl-CoA transferase